jgi:uncharacterized protein GlcG (DUF336 family)
MVTAHVAAAKARTAAVHRSRAAVLRDVGAGTREAYPSWREMGELFRGAVLFVAECGGVR